MAIDQLFDGNMDSVTMRKTTFPHTIIARFIRLNPIDWVNKVALVWELFGCGKCFIFKIDITFRSV